MTLASVKTEIKEVLGTPVTGVQVSVVNQLSVGMKAAGIPITTDNMTAYAQTPAGFAKISQGVDNYVTAHPGSVKTESAQTTLSSNVGLVLGGLGIDNTVDLSIGKTTSKVSYTDLGSEVYKVTNTHQNIDISITNTTTSTTAPTTEIVQVAPVYQQVTTTGTVTDVVARNNCPVMILANCHLLVCKWRLVRTQLMDVLGSIS